MEPQRARPGPNKAGIKWISHSVTEFVKSSKTSKSKSAVRKTLVQSHTLLLLSRWRYERKYTTHTHTHVPARIHKHTGMHNTYCGCSEKREYRFYHTWWWYSDFMWKKMWIYAFYFWLKMIKRLYSTMKELTQLEAHWYLSVLESAEESRYRKCGASTLPQESRSWRKRGQTWATKAKNLRICCKCEVNGRIHQEPAKTASLPGQFWSLGIARISQAILIKGNVSSCHIWFVSKCCLGFFLI